jgi:hypothetical protein
MPYGEIWGPYIEGTRGHVGPLIHSIVKYEPSIGTDLEQQHRLDLGGGGEPTYKGGTDRWTP